MSPNQERLIALGAVFEAATLVDRLARTGQISESSLNCMLGSLLVLAILAAALISQEWLWLLGMPLAGYGFAWVGHFFFEHNRPATFRYPLYSLLGDWVMFKDMLIGRIRF